MRLKTGPRIVIVLVIVSAVGWWANGYIDSRKATQAAQPQLTPIEQLAAQPPAKVGIQQTDALQYAPVIAARPRDADADAAALAASRAGLQSQPVQPRTQGDAALNALINGGRK